jgi:hypothetical protein
LASNDATGEQGHGHGARYRCPEVEEDHMIRATISDVTPQSSLTARDRWGRIFASLVFSTVHLDNTCAKPRPSGQVTA